MAREGTYWGIKDGNLKDVLPDPLQDEIIFDLNSEIKPASRTKGVSEVPNR